MINGNEKWQQVEEKLSELRGLVEENWNNGDWQLALTGENIIKTVEKSQARAADMRQRTNLFLKNIRTLHPDN